MIGIPTTRVKMHNGSHLHHNSMDTIATVDPRTLRELSILNAAFLYFLADAGFEDVPMLAKLTFDWGMKNILDETERATDSIMNADNGESLGEALDEGLERIEYYTGLRKESLRSIKRIVEANKSDEFDIIIARYIDSMDDFGKKMRKHIELLADDSAKRNSIRIVLPQKELGPWEKEAVTLIPKRFHPVTLFFAEIPPEEWVEVKSSPHWWSPTNWAETSYWWCDGKRDLNTIKRLIELEAGQPVRNFDLIRYYKFLEKYNYVEFQ
jgi:hypothetical protein